MFSYRIKTNEGGFDEYETQYVIGNGRSDRPEFNGYFPGSNGCPG
jgi:hypothetical protein